jgi:hypothetical protein
MLFRFFLYTGKIKSSVNVQEYYVLLENDRASNDHFLIIQFSKISSIYTIIYL